MSLLFAANRRAGRTAVAALILPLVCAILLFCVRLPLRSADEAAPARLDLRPGDRICLIGNTLADRMQHDGWLDTYLYSRFPRHDLVIRNLGFSGDELTLRLRSASFGSPDEWLSRCRADVIFAFFGYNESFAGKAGLAKFKTDLDAFIRHTQEQKYNGKGAPRLVLFSPIAHEDLHDPNLPDGRENNARLALYTTAMAEVAANRHVPFVDLFHASADLYASGGKPRTINGIHLTEEGYREVAEVIDRALFPGDPAPRRDPEVMERLRRAVRERNFFWFERYRTVDGYSIYGGRADLEFVDRQTNRVVMQREMEVLDVMTANRDRRVWAAARGQDLAVDDSNTPPFIPVKTNKPGPLPGGAHVFLDGEEAIRHMTVARGMKVTLFASEKEFPELAKPVQMAFDTKGRLWVAAWPSYPHWKPKEEMNDKLLILEDTDGDGKADKCTVFADHLHCPTGFAFWNGGVLVAQAPDILFLKDTDGDGKADLRLRVLHGIDSADTHHTANSFVIDPGEALYFQEGTFHHTQVESPYGPPRRCANAGVYRYEPRTQKFDVYVTFGFANPHGHVFDRWGQDIVIDGTGSQPYHAALFSGHLDFPHKHATPPQVYQQRTRPCPGVAYLSSRHFPAANQGNLLVGNVIGFQGILQYRIDDKGSSFTGTEVEPIVYSSDPNFRPADIKIGPDGAIWFIDWQNPIIGHMQHNLRDPSRDRTHGRVYRVTCDGRPLLKSPAVAGGSVEKLLELLKQPEDGLRARVRTELGARDGREVLAAAKKWLAALDRKDPDYEHHVLEALWLSQSHNVVDTGLLDRVLASPDFRARAAAARVLCYWRDRVNDALERFKKLAADVHPRVRLEAIRAASFFGKAEAVEVPLIAAELPSDVYLDFARGETMKALEPYVRKEIAAGHEIHFTTAAGARYFLKLVGADDLLKMKRTEPVCRELLLRQGIRDEQRGEALAVLARLRGRPEVGVLLDTIRGLDEQPQPPEESVVFDLVRLLTARQPAELAAVRGELEKLATGARLPLTRQLGFVALVAADGGAEAAWALAVKSTATLRDFVTAMPLIRDPGVRAALYPRVEPLLNGLPRELGIDAGKTVLGRYVRVELPGRQRTLTLAEVEVYSDGRNVARQGQASQASTAWGGVAARAIDGNTSGSFGDGGQTHTQEGTPDPWWQVDLGREYPIDRVVIYNRTDGNMGKRLSGFTLKALDAGHRVVYERTRQPAPVVRAAYDVGGESPQRVIRHAAMLALTSVRGQEAMAFKALARFAGDPLDCDAAVQALLRIPAAEWPKDEARPLLETLLAQLRKVPLAERTTPAVLDLMQLADGLAGLLPRDEARRARDELGELGVRVLRLGTVTDQMLYDKERLAVRAGRPVEFVFENTDLMPHNFVITQPGALEEIGNLAEAQATQPGALERNYVPACDRVLLSSRLLQPRDVQTLRWTAPTRPGVYPYVCTYPGHWRRMHGALYVVEDLEEYLADPAAYLTRHPLPVADELLKLNRPRTEWKYEDLTDAVTHLEDGRSFANARQMFQVANCVACHRLNGTGTEVGPDLSKLDPKRTPAEIVRDILEPSFRIEDRYATYVFELESGKQVTGVVLQESPEAFTVVENPLAKSKPVVIRKSDIAERKKSPTSIMPKGLLDRLTREEVLDLMAYVVARGDARHRLFQGAHVHGHAHGH
jgi:putative heme-binding domain-containing protein